jgi:hypothetical protein
LLVVPSPLAASKNADWSARLPEQNRFHAVVPGRVDRAGRRVGGEHVARARHQVAVGDDRERVDVDDEPLDKGADRAVIAHDA